MVAVTCELKWMIGLLKFLGITPKGPIPLKCDSQSALYIARNPVFHERTKHIEIDCHFVRDAIKAKFLALSYVQTTEQWAYILTKSLGVTHFHYLVGKIGLLNLYAPS